MAYVDKKQSITPELVKKPPKPPDILNADGKREWRRLVGLLIKEKIYTQFDRQSVLVACLEWERYVSCIRVVKEEGETWKGKNGYVQIRPEATQANKSFAAYTKMLQRFGQDPESRQKIKKVEKEKEDNNPFGDI